MGTDVSSDALVVNPAYATRDRDRVTATLVPPGFWAVKIRPHGESWIVFCVPRKGNTNHPFLIATTPVRNHATLSASRWYDSATVLVMHPGRIVMAGRGDATEESKPGFDPAELLAVIA